MAALVYLVDDLFFVARIRETAAALGVEVARAPDPESVVATAREARLVILDLRRPDALRALDLLGADAVARAVPSLGFIDHENVEGIEAARRHGCATVLSKRKFASDLPALLSAAAPNRGA